jgi:tetratricopeptide (TPR) repeat protein
VRALLEGSARGLGRPLALESQSIARAAGYSGPLAPMAESVFATTGQVTYDDYDRAGRMLGDSSEDRFHRGTPLGPRGRSLWSRAFGELGALGLGDATLPLALGALNRAIMFSPERAVGWTNFGVALERVGRYEDALRATQRAVLLGPERPTAWVNLARLYRRLGDDASARAVLVRAEQAGVRDARLSALALELQVP